MGRDLEPRADSRLPKTNAQPTIRHERLYPRIYADKTAGSTLHLALRCQKPCRKCYGSGQDRRGPLPNQVSIDKRPSLVHQRERLGDGEGDRVIGTGQNKPKFRCYPVAMRGETMGATSEVR